MTLTFPEARAAVLREILPAEPVVETVSLDECAGRILAEDITADRDYPPFPRSARDGFAIRSADAPGLVLTGLLGRANA
jgi:molybdopterin molybdotransferase